MNIIFRPNKIQDKFKIGATCVVGVVAGLGLIGLAGCATTGGYAQQQNQAQQYEEIDYEHMNLLKSNRVIGEPDFYKGKVVFGVNITKNTPLLDPVNSNWEIFIADKDGSNQKKLTYTKDTAESLPFFTTEGRIAYRSLKRLASEEKYFLMDENGNNKQEISRGLLSAYAKERVKEQEQSSSNK